ncbi:MAG: hypothetical protein KAV87_31830 [Desulfobacteraceae bacterium]|nr:hypothetical protein [Desulfobacteraceae bacterium]
MSYHNYRDKKEEELVKLNKRISIQKIVSAGEVKEEEQVFFELETKKFNEDDGKPRQYPEREEIDTEALEKEKVLLQGFIEDIDELLADIKTLKEE